MMKRSRCHGYIALLILVVTLNACARTGRNKASLSDQAETAIARGDTARAVHLLQGAIRSRDASIESFTRLGALSRSENTIQGRLRAKRILEEGLKRHPNDPDLMMELGKTLYGQTFYPDAQRCFERVLELDPDRCDAHYYLGLNWFRKWKHVQIYWDHLNKANHYLRYAVYCGPDNQDAYHKLAFSHYALGDTLETIYVCDRFVQDHPDAADPYFLKGVVAFEAQGYEETHRYFKKALSKLSDADRDAILDISLLLDEETAEEYERASIKKREESRRSFWMERDPDVTTPINERYLEHVYRMYLADAFYAIKRMELRGWEVERGRALVKFGWPMAVGSTLRGKFTTGRMEIWHYESGLTFFFRDEFLNGNYMVPMDIEYSFAAQALYLEEPTTEIVQETIPIPGVLDLVTFRNTPYSSDVYLTLKVDADSMDSHIDVDDVSSFVTRTAFFDDAWQPFFYQTDTLSSDVLAEREVSGRRWFYMVMAFNLPFDRHRVAFSLEDIGSATQAIVKGEESTLRYFADTLTVSDILLYHLPPDGSTATIDRGGQTFFPSPGGIYVDDEKLRLYLEVYNLGLTQSLSDYEITYSIFEPPDRKRGIWQRLKSGVKKVAGFLGPPEPVISQTLQRRGASRQAEEILAIDIDALRPGTYALTVSVHDHSTGRVATQTAHFSREAN